MEEIFIDIIYYLYIEDVVSIKKYINIFNNKLLFWIENWKIA